jgi:Transposase DDE domain
MLSSVHTALIGTLKSHFCLSKSRLATFATLIAGLVNGRTVNLAHLASQFSGSALHASNYRRLQRFFQHVHLEADAVAHIVVRMLNLNGPWLLALDRTNWKLGSRDVNILMLALVTRRFRVPLLWMLLDHPGNSNTDQRITLMRRYLALFEASSIKLLLADREFIGADWMDFLHENNISFAIRVKVDMCIEGQDGHVRSFKTLLRRKRARRRAVILHASLQGETKGSHAELSFAAKLFLISKQLKDGEWLIIATNYADPYVALNAYRKRWGVECLFSDTKTRGLNLEDTHLTCPQKLSSLLVIITLAMTWSYRCATKVMGRQAIRRKSHKRREKSWFRTGFDALRNWIIIHPKKAIEAWLEKFPKPSPSTMKNV